jgi:hypothetical protein
MSVFRDVTIAWEGVDYVFTPNMRFLRRIEGQGVNIATLIHGLTVGPIGVTSLSFVATECLKLAGAIVSEEQVYQHIMNGTKDQIDSIAVAVAEAVTPKAPNEKKPEAPRASPPRSRKPKAKSNT